MPGLGLASGLTLEGAQSVSAVSVDLSWSAAAGGGPTADNTIVQWGTDNVTFPNEQSEAAGATTATVSSGLSASTTYYFRVVRRNAAGDSDPTNTVTVNT